MLTIDTFFFFLTYVFFVEAQPVDRTSVIKRMNTHFSISLNLDISIPTLLFNMSKIKKTNKKNFMLVVFSLYRLSES